MTDLRYSDSELAAFSIADKVSDDVHVPKEEILKALLAVTHSSYQARKHLYKAKWGLVEKSKAKRDIIKKLIEMEENS